MRLKCYAAPTVSDAMRQIRDELGDDAVIVSTQTGDNGTGVMITAALEAEDTESELAALLKEDPARDFDDTVGRALAFHGVPNDDAGDILAEANRTDTDDPITALAASLKTTFTFQGLEETTSKQPILLVGPPGAGKTLTVAKLATRAAIEKQAINLITTDTFRAGAISELQAFAKILETDLIAAESAADLKRRLNEIDPQGFTIIDSTGANPFATGDMSGLARLISAGNIEPILVLAAGGDSYESADIASAFHSLGARRIIITKLDITRRLGSVIAAALAGPLRFCEVSISPHVARGLNTLSPTSLARLLMRDPYSAETRFPGREVAQ